MFLSSTITGFDTSAFQGNLEFVSENDCTSIKNQDSLAQVSQCLGVPPEQLEKSLCQRVIAARGEVMEKVHTVSEAVYGRDAFAKVKLRSHFYKNINSNFIPVLQHIISI